ncbi:hypothetical protein A0H81_09096 [Grifola frondosa]|uniref:Uncharacterized protein n=1 Tax=Grifola frondosa TaxID=5627 RepID=A0A1C7M0Y8_GRIFR|nr:hypothetical protein A0H81_09096 [Grifola frondosa]
MLPFFAWGSVFQPARSQSHSTCMDIDSRQPSTICDSDLLQNLAFGISNNGSRLAIVSRSCSTLADLLVLGITWLKTYKTMKVAAQANLKLLILRDGTIYFVVLLIFNAFQIFISTTKDVGDVVIIENGFVIAYDQETHAELIHAQNHLRPARADAQGSNVTCLSAYIWMINSTRPKSLLSLITVIDTFLQLWCFVNLLDPGYHYNTPSVAMANECACNTVFYSTMAACAICQVYYA